MPTRDRYPALYAILSGLSNELRSRWLPGARRSLVALGYPSLASGHDGYALLTLAIGRSRRSRFKIYTPLIIVKIAPAQVAQVGISCQIAIPHNTLKSSATYSNGAAADAGARL